jgi:gluconolactonase
MVLGQIRLTQTAANLTFADNGRTVYITVQTTVYRFHVVTPGEVRCISDRRSPESGKFSTV